jgi:hypothetical protein
LPLRRFWKVRSSTTAMRTEISIILPTLYANRRISSKL